MTKARVNADNASADIQGVTAGTGLTGGGTSGTVTLTNDMATAIDAKGDLVVGTGADTYDNLAVGNNGETLVADSSASTGLRWQGSTAAGRNFLINGNFDIFQRSSFSSQTSSGYTLDRWYAAVGGTVTVSQQTTGVPVGSRYCMRVAYNANSSFANISQPLEQDNVSQLWGRTVVATVRLRRNATFAANLNVQLEKNSTANTATGGSWSQIASTTITNANLPTGTTASDWVTATISAVVPSDGTANGLRLIIAESATGSTNGYFEVAQAQLEVGSVATTFTRAGGTLAGELAACQRYYFRATSGTAYGLLGFGTTYSPTIAVVGIVPPVTMRTIPTAIESLSLALNDTVTRTALTSATLAGNTTPNYLCVDATVASGLTGYRPVFLQTNNSATGYVAFTAEL